MQPSCAARMRMRASVELDVGCGGGRAGCLAVLTGADLAACRHAPRRVGRRRRASPTRPSGARARRGPLCRRTGRRCRWPGRARKQRTPPSSSMLDYEPLDPRRSIRAPPPTSRRLVRWARSRGDVEAAFAAADRVVALLLLDPARSSPRRSSPAARSPSTTRRPTCSSSTAPPRTRTGRSRSSARARPRPERSASSSPTSAAPSGARVRRAGGRAVAAAVLARSDTR